MTSRRNCQLIMVYFSQSTNHFSRQPLPPQSDEESTIVKLFHHDQY